MSKFLTVLFVTNAVFLLGYTQDPKLLIPLNVPIIISFLLKRGATND